MYQKISTNKAHALYAQHKPFYMCASKMRPDIMGCKIDRWSFEQLADIPFDTMVNEYRYYNCNPETGRHVVFYQKIN